MLKPILFLVVAGLLSCPASVLAQEPDPLEFARVRLGPFGFTPAIMTTGGYDSNVTREPGAIGDYEVVTVPQLETWLSLGRFLLNTQSAFESFWYSNQEPTWTFNHHNGGTVTFTGSRLEPEAGFVYRDTYARPTGYEINSRSRRLEKDATASLTWHTTPALTLSADGRRKRTDWAADAVNEGSQLEETMNRTSTTASAGIAYALTPLTNFEVRLVDFRDRFDNSPSRDTDSTAVLCGVRIDSPALFSGSALVGYTHYSSPASGAADYSGVIAAVNLLYSSESRTQVGIAFDRYPSVSYSENFGYYLLSSLSANVSQYISERWQVTAFAGRHFLDYSVAGLPGAEGQNTRRTDVGGGVSWRPGPFMRIGLDLSGIVYTGGQAFNATRAVAYFVYGSDRLVRVDRPLPEDR